LSDKSDGVAALLTQLRQLGLPEPVTEHPFRGLSGKRKWRFDLAWPDRQPPVAVEVQGGTWLKGGGRHNRAAGYERDCHKLSQASICGWKLVWATTAMCFDGTAIGYIERALEEAEDDVCGGSGSHPC